MNSPKEKARDLFETYFCQLSYYYSAVDDEHAKQCALIAVDEIIQTYHSPMDDEQIQEWQEIKQEIELL